jgi:hypothetical protein
MPTTRTQTPETVARRALRLALHALGKSSVLDVKATTVTNSTDHQSLVQTIEALPRPYAVWVVRVKDDAVVGNGKVP